jgi:hypothetical protein
VKSNKKVLVLIIIGGLLEFVGA